MPDPHADTLRPLDTYATVLATLQAGGRRTVLIDDVIDQLLDLRKALIATLDAAELAALEFVEEAK